MKLFCAVVGAQGSAFEVKIDNTESVSAFKEAIAAELRYKGRPDMLELFLAKTESGWLSNDDDLITKLLQNRIDTSKLKALWPTWKLNRAKNPQLFGRDVSLGENVVHVLVRFPEDHSEIGGQRPMKRLKTNEVDMWEWKEEEPVYSRDRQLFFADREEAVKDLVTFHKLNFYRAKLRAGGLCVIPLLDNVVGLGKSAFGQEYIRKCQSLEADPTVPDFMDTLRSCHTITIKLNQTQVLNKNSDFDVHLASRSLIECIWAFFQVNYDTFPHALDNLEENYRIVLTKLTEEVGPLFIVIDEIGLTFDHGKLDNVARRDQFFKFCKLLHPLFENRKLFFLISGRASFLNHVARRPLGENSMTTTSPVDFKRLHLHLLRPEAIKTVIENTRWVATSSESIKTHLQLTDNQVKDLSARLGKTTFGHPRSLWEAFETCQSYGELFNYMPDPLKGVDWKNFNENVWLYRTQLKYLMGRALIGQETDLSESCRDDGGKEITYEEMASAFGIRWEGSMTNARLYMPSYLQKTILAAVFKVKDLLLKVAPAISHISIDYPDVFEMLCMNRFQEMFSNGACPHKVLPSFFTEEQRFGQCIGVKFLDRTFQMPTITRQSAFQSPSLASKTAHSDKADIAMAETRDRTSQLSLKSHPQSLSTIVLLSAIVQGMILTVGLAVKTCSTSAVTATIVDEEREKFDLLLSKKDGYLNVLFVCATKYGGNLQAAFGSAKAIIYTEAMESTEKKVITQHIHEVILLNLTTPQYRAEFFGLPCNDALQTCLEKVIHKVGVRDVETVPSKNG